jgi:transposase
VVAELREVDTRLAKLSAQVSEALAEHSSRLPEVDGIGPVVATRLLGCTGRASRSPASSAFAS